MKYDNLRAFEKHLAGASPANFSPVYLILSKDAFLQKNAYKLLTDNILKDAADPLAIKNFDEEKLDIDAILLELNSISFFTKKKIVIIQAVENLQKNAFEKLLLYYKNPLPSTYLVLVGSSLIKTTSFYKETEKLGVILDIPEEKPYEKEKSAREWLYQKALQNNKQIEAAASFLLLKQVGTDLSLLNQEMEKLITFVDTRPCITEKDIAEVCISEKVDTIWQLGESIFKKDGSTALLTALSMLQEGTALLSLLRQLRSQFQTELHIATILQSGGTLLDVTQQFAYLKGALLDKHLQYIKNYGYEKFKKGLLLIDDSELQAKSGSLENSYIIEKLIFKLI